MTTLTAITDKAARLIFYGLIVAAPVCGGGSGGVQSGACAHQGPHSARIAVTGLHAIPLSRGENCKVIEPSTDERRSWTTGFDAIYRKRG